MRDFNKTPEQAQQLWIEALRGGGYKQTTGMLCRTTASERDIELGEIVGYCCLGVACDLFNDHEPEVAMPVTEDEHSREWDAEASLLPQRVRDWLGLTSVDGDYIPDYDDDHLTSLADKNDSGADFDEIADIIEDRPEGMFE